jgi:hypothetical protein
MGFGAGVNFYTYVDNNPVNANDPSGLCGPAIPVCIAAAEAIGPEAAVAVALQAARITEYGILAYNKLRPAILGLGLEAHHLLEQRFATILEMKGKDMLSVAISKGEHQALTNAWRKAIPYGTGTGKATKKLILEKAAEIYKSNPTILKALGLATIGSGSANASATAPPTALISATNSAMNDINASITPVIKLGTLSVDLMGFGDGANGGFVLYPNKSNNNMARAVYAK